MNNQNYVVVDAVEEDSSARSAILPGRIELVSSYDVGVKIS
ncbi:hypothetical protein [Bacillus sp. SA1-12]|nr:hypothetical protein [Bacillus sp. SA1-12]